MPHQPGALRIPDALPDCCLQTHQPFPSTDRMQILFERLRFIAPAQQARVRETPSSCRIPARVEVKSMEDAGLFQRTRQLAAKPATCASVPHAAPEPLCRTTRAAFTEDSSNHSSSMIRRKTQTVFGKVPG